MSKGQYFAVIHDYLGSSRVVIDVDKNKIVEANHYDPTGVEYGLSDDPYGVQPYKHQGKERLRITGISLHNHGARNADNVMIRWLTRDPLEEDYYWNNAYCLFGNNGVKYVDRNGKEISVDKEHQEQFMSDIRNVFGDKADKFSFNENGSVQLDENAKDFTKGMTKDQKQAFKGMDKLMKSEDKYSVSYQSSYTTKDGSETIDVDREDIGGGMFYGKDRAIVVSPNAGTINVTPDDNVSIVTEKQVAVRQNTTSVLFHEFGEALAGKAEYRGSVIDYENRARRIIDLPKRPTDMYHSYTINGINGELKDYLKKP
jgi:RHS repeat-associated protein